MINESYEDAIKNIKAENEELFRTQWVGIIALFMSVATFIVMVMKSCHDRLI